MWTRVRDRYYWFREQEVREDVTAVAATVDEEETKEEARSVGQ
jgi:hypothetical protein